MEKLKALVLPTEAHLQRVCPPDVYNLINEYFDAKFNKTGAEYTKEEQDAMIGDAEVLLTTWGSPILDADSILKAEKLKYIGHAAGTVKSRVPFGAFERGIRVFSAARRISDSVADWCMAAIMTMLRRFPEFDAGMRAGAPWAGGDPFGYELTGAEIGIVALSSTAKALLPLLAPFRCDILAYDPYATEDQANALGARLGSLEEVMSRPIVSVHLPVLPSTLGMITKEHFALIPDGGLFINSSRSVVLDEAALIAELASGRIRGALDVFGVEPLPSDSPLLALKNVLLTPHIAGATAQSYAALMRAVVENIINAIEGKPTEYEIKPASWDLLA